MGANSNTQIDQLVYNYSADNPNRLDNVSDANNSTSTQYTGLGFRNITGAIASYTYDTQGNLTADPYKGLTLGYNILNKTDNIKVVNGPGGTVITGRYINYTYDATGKVIRKQQYDNVNNTSTLINTTDYIDGFVYINNSLSYFPMGEGRVINTGGSLKPEYIIADQQGNARFSFQDNGSGGVKVIQENSYYAFGLTLANSPISMPTVPNKQLFNGGSEWQNDYSNLPDYYQTFYRNYDATLGRFIAVDPMAEKSLSLSGYQFSNNNPVSFNDPLGNDPPDVDPPIDGPGPEEGVGTYGGYEPSAESTGSSTTGTDEGGKTNGGQDGAYATSGNSGLDTSLGGGVITTSTNSDGLLTGSGNSTPFDFSAVHNLDEVTIKAISTDNGEANQGGDNSVYNNNLKTFFAVIAGESSNNLDEARAIGSVLLNRTIAKKTSFYDPNWLTKVGASGLDAVGGKIYNEVIKMDINDLLVPTGGYKTRFQGALDAFNNWGCIDFSKGAYFWNASCPQSGANWDRVINGTWVGTAAYGNSTFMKYSSDDPYGRVYP